MNFSLNWELNFIPSLGLDLLGLLSADCEHNFITSFCDQYSCAKWYKPLFHQRLLSATCSKASEGENCKRQHHVGYRGRRHSWWLTPSWSREHLYQTWLLEDLQLSNGGEDLQMRPPLLYSDESTGPEVLFWTFFVMFSSVLDSVFALASFV